jgi:CHAT domain-containing protein
MGIFGSTDHTFPEDRGEMTCYCLGLIQELTEIIKNVSHRQSRKRVWWCPIAALGSFPIHAAGVYDGPHQDHVGNYVVSSYTPTLTALHRLLEEKRHSHVVPPTNPNILLIAQPDVTGQPSLPNAQLEVDLVRSLLPHNFAANEMDPQGMSVRVSLEQAETAHIVHLACHGHQDQNDPLQSGFDLKDGRLTLSKLMHMSTPHAQLAYLSACESAGMDESRPDEGLNLVGAMIFAGFKSVIGTLW